jgi:hypothetical protein
MMGNNWLFRAGESKGTSGACDSRRRLLLSTEMGVGVDE